MKNEILEYLLIKDDKIKNFVNIIKSSNIDFMEHSVKISQDEYLDNRILFAFKSVNNSKNFVKEILESLTNNKQLIQESLIQYTLCDIFGIAFEVTDEINCRIYFETEMTLYTSNIIRSKNQIKKTNIIGYKWNLNSDQYLITQYDFFVRLNIKIIKKYMKDVEDVEFTNFVINQYLSNNINSFYTVYDKNSPRNSIDIGLRNFDISLLPKSIKNINVSDVAKQKINQYNHMKIYHISFGKDKSNKNFFTLYFRL